MVSSYTCGLTFQLLIGIVITETFHGVVSMRKKLERVLILQNQEPARARRDD